MARTLRQLAASRILEDMSGFTIQNLRAVEDAAPRFGFAPALEARFASRDLGLTMSGVSLQRLAPNATQPFGHRHRRQEELYVVVAGAGRVKLDDEVVEVGPWDAVRVEPQVTRAFAAGPDGLEYLAFGAPATGDTAADVDMTPGWWAD
jgi:mannose-6-phosphate isomerase-like protein (cupin superfamily)